MIRSNKVPSYNVRKYLRFKGIFELKYNDQVRLNLMSYGNTIENELFWQGIDGWERLSLQLWGTLCQQSKVIFDVGANTGLYTLIAAKVNPEATIYAFEPLPKVFDRLQHNVDINSIKPILCQVALADEDAIGSIFVADTVSDTFDQATLNATRASKTRNSSVEIAKRKLSTFISEHQILDVDLIKIDVETYEPQVLRGMQAYLKMYRPSMLIEILNDTVGEEVQMLLNGLNYEYYKIDERVGCIKQLNLVPGVARGCNFLILNPQKHGGIRPLL